MSESVPPSGGANEVPEVVVEKGRGISPIWLIPIVALIVAGYLAYEAVQERGPQVVVLFESAEGLVAGKSKVKYREVEVGTVDLIQLHDTKHVAVHCSLDKRTTPHLTESTRFWAVRPRVGGGQLSGLGTIVSGAYLTFEPGNPDDPPALQFTGLENPPLPAEESPGLRIVLRTDHLGGLDTGAPVFFRDIHVGDVVGWTLPKDGNEVDVKVAISSSHAHLVRSGSRFWNAGGVELSLGPGGLDIKTESLRSILAGGVAFDSPGGEPAKAGDTFRLYNSRADVLKASMAKSPGGLHLVLESGILGGIAEGNAVYYREVPVGSVVSHELVRDGSRVRIHLNIERRYASLVRNTSVFWNAGGVSANLGLHGLRIHTESLKALLAGGVAFATPPKKLGQAVKAGTVFQLHHEPKDDWLEWQGKYAPGKAKDEKKPDEVEEVAEEEAGDKAGQEEPEPAEDEAGQEDSEPSEDKEDKGFLRGIFDRGD